MTSAMNEQSHYYSMTHYGSATGDGEDLENEGSQDECGKVSQRGERK